MRCACGNRLDLETHRVTVCAACQLWHWTDATYRQQAAKEVGLRERIAARWPGYDAVGRYDEDAANSPDVVGAKVEVR